MRKSTKTRGLSDYAPQSRGRTARQRFGRVAEKHVVFGLAGEAYGVPLLQLQEIVAGYTITPLPNMPRFFHGVVELRGAVIPLLNLRRRFGLPNRDRDRRTRAIVVDMQPNPIAVEVDEVHRVVGIAAKEIWLPPALAGGQRVPFVSGVSTDGAGKLIIHLDVQELLNSVEQLPLDEIREAFEQQLQEQAADEAAPDGAAVGARELSVEPDDSNAAAGEPLSADDPPPTEARPQTAAPAPSAAESDEASAQVAEPEPSAAELDEASAQVAEPRPPGQPDGAQPSPDEPTGADEPEIEVQVVEGAELAGSGNGPAERAGSAEVTAGTESSKAAALRAHMRQRRKAGKSTGKSGGVSAARKSPEAEQASDDASLSKSEVSPEEETK